jgi:hypothetical protein
VGLFRTKDAPLSRFRLCWLVRRPSESNVSLIELFLNETLKVDIQDSLFLPCGVMYGSLGHVPNFNIYSVTAMCG